MPSIESDLTQLVGPSDHRPSSIAPRRPSENNIDWLTLLNASTPAPLPYAWPNVFGPDINDFTMPHPLVTDTGWQMPSGEASTGAQLISALQSQVPTLQGDPQEDQNLQLYYYRFVSDNYSSAMVSDLK